MQVVLIHFPLAMMCKTRHELLRACHSSCQGRWYYQFSLFAFIVLTIQNTSFFPAGQSTRCQLKINRASAHPAHLCMIVKDKRKVQYVLYAVETRIDFDFCLCKCKYQALDTSEITLLVQFRESVEMVFNFVSGLLCSSRVPSSQAHTKLDTNQWNSNLSKATRWQYKYKAID